MELTKAIISAMPAGTELDELIATKVMGWEKRKVETRFYSKYSIEIYGWYCGELGPVAFCQDSWPHEAWRPSQDIRDAWRVVENFQAKGNDLVLEHWGRTPHIGDGNWVALWELPNAHDTGQFVAKTAPLAICRSALITVLGL